MPAGSSSDKRDALLAFPGWKHLWEALLLSLAFTAWFGLIYGSADLITGWHSRRVPIHWEAELAIPLVPASVLLYMSIYPLFWLGPFVLRSTRELRAFVASLALTTLVAGIGFLLIPAETAFPPAMVTRPWTGIYNFADQVNLRFNSVPSLHVALAILCVDIYSRRARLVGRMVLWTWGAAIAASTVFTHFHHLLDVLTGLALGLAISRWIFPRWACN